jgi:exosortase C (VPDSG-CTERM-specific)
MTADKLNNLANEQHGVAAQQSSARRSGRPVKRFGPFGRFVLVTVGLVLCFSGPLYHLVRVAANSQLYSHILLIPFISMYLVWLKRQRLPRHSEPVRRLAALPLVAGAVVLVGYWFAVRSASTLAKEDSLALTTFSFLLFFVGVCCLFLGKETLRAIAFPIGFLVFMVPFPAFLRDWIDVFLQHTSAAAAYAMFKLSGTPVFRQELGFHLPGFSLEVGPECSGIHSSLVLFITSLLAGHLFLRTPWKRAVLALAVIPLAILRNGFRIFTIGQLCVHIGPEMIHSNIHRRGGPLFFVLSLVPFFLLLIVLWRSDRVREKTNPKQLGV